MSVQFCLALLALSSLTAASDPDCEELIKPLEDRSRKKQTSLRRISPKFCNSHQNYPDGKITLQVHGKWILHAATSDSKEALQELKVINSSWIELSPIPDSDDMTLRYGDKIKDGQCHYGSVNTTFSGNSTKVTFYFNSSTFEHVGKHLVTCPDCILWTDDSVAEGKNRETRKGRNFYLFTKSGTLDAAHLEVFKKQAACLNFPPEFHFGEATDLCPDATDAAEEEH